tara:strand:- start:3144 stop:3590 length:447 start_codon:yes stop_codon:yes gene_type:complete
MILESLQAHTQTLGELSSNTSIEAHMLQNSLKELLTKNLIITREGEYALNHQLNQTIRNELNDKTNLMCEVQEIINSCLRKTLQEGQSHFKLKKVNMTQREYKIYKGLEHNLEAFLNSLEKNDQVASQTLVFWGEGKYEDIKNSILNY